MLNIRIAGVADADLICKLAAETFYESYAAENTAEDMKMYIEANFSMDAILNELKHPQTMFLLAELGALPAGYIQINFQKQREEFNPLKQAEIERLYVCKSLKGQGIGYRLVTNAIQVAKEKYCGMLWLGVWERNSKAITFYQKMGFAGFGKHIFQLGNDKQTDILMKLDI